MNADTHTHREMRKGKALMENRMEFQKAPQVCPNAGTCSRACARKFLRDDEEQRSSPEPQVTIPANITNAKDTRSWQRFSIAALAATVLAFGTAPASKAQDVTPLVSKGDAIVTGFSGTRQDPSVPGNVHPLDRTFIDGDGAALKIVDVSALGSGPEGKLAEAPFKHAIKASDIGQVFATTLVPQDEGASVDILAAATSFYGLHIVKASGDGTTQRSLKGGPGTTWMPGQFSGRTKGGPGSIWKIDGTTGDVTLFASVASKGKPNAGPGIGGLAYDETHNQIFASNLETGFIHRFDMSGQVVGQFDHGETALWGVGRRAVPFRANDRVEITDPTFNSEDPSTWGYADKARRVVALARHKDRLFYSVAEGPELWSVGISDDGSFAGDARLEIDLGGTPSDAPITKILFDGSTSLYLSQRGETAGSYDYSVFATPDQASVLRYTWDSSEQEWITTPDEIAVGLKQPYRSTDGGIALGYGYDSGGDLQFGQCATTLWTTGSNLRDGEDADRVKSGGRRLFSGLQGVAKTSGAPLNASEPLTGSSALQGVVDYFFGGSDTAPWNSWFVASGAQDQETRRVGHSGDVAIYAPCQAVAEVTEPPEIVEPVDPPIDPIDPEIPPGTPVISIDKVCQPGALGGVVACTITLTNTGSETPVWPVVFSDLSTIIAGPGAGTVTDITSATPDGPDWFCTPTPTPDFACALPGPALPPGAVRSVTVQLDTAGLINAGNFGFKNCATLAWPHVGQACDEGGHDLKFEKTGPAVAVATGDATYTLKITNTGTLPFNGDVQLTDRLFISGAPVAVPVVAINPDPQCVGGPPAAVPFSCVAPLSLAAGADTSFEITVTMPADPAGVGYWAQNCFAVTDPGFGPPPGPPGPGAGQSCVWTEVLPTNVASNIRVDKTALNGAKCQKAAADIIECDYEITLTNEGPLAFSDFVTLNETVPANATLTSGDPGLVCGGAAPDYLCNTGGSVDLANGASISFPMKLTMTLPHLEAQGCEMLNRVKLAAPAGGTQANFKVTDDEATASADAFLQWWVGGFLFITCDPTNIKVEKVAKGPCIDAGNSSWRCDYDVTLTNLGPDPLTSVIKLKETFSATPTALTFDAAWNCSGGGTNYDCEHPALNLQKGDTLKFSVSAEVPDKGLCSLKNTAHLTFPIAGTRGNSSGSDDTASAVAEIPSKKCIKPVPEIDPIYPIVDPVPTCPDGSKRRANGRCPCPQGETWSRYDRACVPKQCHDPDRRKPNGACCPRGTIWNSSYGACTKSCPDGQRWDPKQQRCVSIYDCPSGTQWNRKLRRCIPIISCSRYERWSWNRMKCVPLTCKQIEKRGLPRPERCQDHAQCGKNEELRGDKCICKRGYFRHKGECVRRKRCRLKNSHYDYDLGRCVCNKGYRKDKRRCVPDIVIDPPPPPPPQCTGKNERKNRYGMCVCKRGFERRNGICEPKVTGPTCPDGKPVPKSGQCPCGSRQVWNAKLGKCEDRPPTACRANDAKCFCKLRGGTWRRGKCRMPDSAADTCRKKGRVWKNGRCLPNLSDKVKCKLQGKKWKNGRCIDKETTLPIYCPNGLPKPKNGRCPPVEASPKEKCLKKGGQWKNGKCRTGPSKQLLCKLQGKVWKNGRCQAKGPTLRQKCIAKGGNWMNGTCKPKVSKKVLCALQGKVWRKGKCRAKPKKTRPKPTTRPVPKKPPVLKLPKTNNKVLKPQSLQQKRQLRLRRQQSQVR